MEATPRALRTPISLVCTVTDTKISTTQLPIDSKFSSCVNVLVLVPGKTYLIFPFFNSFTA